MGIYDREYYRERTRGSGWFSGATPACKWILIANIACFLLPRFLPDDRVLYEWFAAYSRLIFEKGQVWRLITATFLHNPDNIWHIVGNMLFLWFIGREMETFYGTREFCWLYGSAALAILALIGAAAMVAGVLAVLVLDSCFVEVMAEQPVTPMQVVVVVGSRIEQDPGQLTEVVEAFMHVDNRVEREPAIPYILSQFTARPRHR